ncbi:MAG TPA: transcriptional regulator [Firmicutes bacterium]|nr:transcriptional regulator [Bacillota bacterium]
MKKKVTCEIEITLNVIGGKYKPIILYILIEEGVKRFGELKAMIPSISHKTLTNQLRELEDANLISRKSYSTIPPKVEYTITEKGLTLYPVLSAMCDWGYEHMTDDYELINPICTESC